uniref:INO80 complex subunit E n=1 Tax=Steinernema glaseri TaxID=37863 RepID=A0A1I7Z152_9BILA
MTSAPQPQQIHPQSHPVSIAPAHAAHPHHAAPATVTVHHMAPQPPVQAPPTKIFHDLDDETKVVPAKEHYRQLKRKFKDVVYENECYQEELRNLQRKLLKLSRDKNFLLDRLAPYEKDNMSESSDDSDASVVTVEEKLKPPPKKKTRPPPKKKAAASAGGAGPSTSTGATTGATSRRTSRPAPPKVKVEVTPLPPIARNSQPSTSGLGNSRIHHNQMHHFQHIDDNSSDRLKPLSPGNLTNSIANVGLPMDMDHHPQPHISRPPPRG